MALERMLAIGHSLHLASQSLDSKIAASQMEQPFGSQDHA
jgi:hypothetical protein